MGMSPVEQTVYQNPHIDISVAGVLLEKNKTADRYTLSVNLDSDATIDDVYFSENMQLRYMNKEKKLNIAAPESRTFNVKFLRKYDVAADGKGMIYSIPIQYSEYKAVNPEEYFECKDTDDHILISLLQLWRKKYNPIIDTRDPLFKNFDDFFEDLTDTDIVKQFRDHDYRFNVREVILSSS